MLENFRMFAAYNNWANKLLYDAAAGLSAEDYRRDCQVFFRSMQGTLNHILAADQIWMMRFTGAGQAPAKLDALLHEDLADLGRAREAMDTRIIEFVDSLDAERLGGNFTYTPITKPEPVTQKLAPALAHFFNHQTHHRGQAHAMLTRLAGEAPALDLIYFQREAGMVTA